MNETVRETSQFERLVTMELTNAEIDSAKASAARRLSKDIRIPGFRPGKAPRPVVEAAVGTARRKRPCAAAPPEPPAARKANR